MKIRMIPGWFMKTNYITNIQYRNIMSVLLFHGILWFVGGIQSGNYVNFICVHSKKLSESCWKIQKLSDSKQQKFMPEYNTKNKIFPDLTLDLMFQMKIYQPLNYKGYSFQEVLIATFI